MQKIITKYFMLNSNITKNNSFKAQRGFSVVELVVTLGVAGILIGTAVPSMEALVNSFARSDAIQQLQFDLNAAKSLALAEGATAVFAWTDGGGGYNVGLDYFPTQNPPVIEEIKFARNIQSSVTVGFSANIVFDSRGFVIDSYGQPTSASVMLYSDGSTICEGTLSPIGILSLSC